MKNFLDGLNTHATGAFGATLFTPALVLLANQSYSETIVKHFFPHLNTDFIPLGGSILVGLAGWLLYQSRPHNVAEEAK
jgi:hypothetical protein